MAVEALTYTGSLILDPLYALWNALVSVLPSIVVAILVLILGYAVAYLMGHIVKVVLEKIGLNKHVRDAHLTKSVGHTNVPSLTGEIVKWFVFLLFLQVGVDILNLSTMSLWLDTFVRWLPNLIVAVIIFFVGIALAHYVDLKIRQHTVMKGMTIVGGLLKAVIMILAVLVGLKQIGIGVELLENSFLLILASIGLGFALAVGIGLGLGLRKEAEDIVKRIKRNF
jgi:hypothetical protein